MTDTTTGAAAPSGGAPTPVNVQTETGPLSIRAAAAAFRERADKGQAAAEPEAPAEGETEQTQQPSQPQRAPDGKFAARQESTPDGEDTAAETPSGEELGTEAVEEPPIEPPHSWTKAEKERFASLPRETQAYLAERESARDAELNRRQNEAAEKTKALTAKEQAAEQARQQYEQAAQNALAILQRQQASEFPDIKTFADVEKLAADDPFRYAQWDARQKAIERQHHEVQANEQRRAQEKQTTFKTWAEEQDAKFTKKFPEFADKEKAGKVRDGIVSYLTKDIGVPEEHLPKLWETDLFRDAMFQEVVYDASRFRAAQAKAKAAVQKPVPPVQRPGAVQGKGEARQADIAALQTKLAGSTNVRDQIATAAAIAAAKRQARPH